MDEILRRLPAAARVLDLGSAGGSFDARRYRCRTFRVDRERAPESAAGFVQADAVALPFPSTTFDAVIANHSVEHFSDLDRALGEIGRVLKPSGALFVSVPDATTFTDRLYRWLGRGGGHVNNFRSAGEVIERIQRVTGLQAAACRLLHTSLSFLNRRNLKTRPQRKLLLFAGGREPVLIVLNAVLRIADRMFGTRLSVYGWALYFGSVPQPLDATPRVNVCVRCGAGHAAAWLISSGCVRGRFPFRRYTCPACGAHNCFTGELRAEQSARRP